MTSQPSRFKLVKRGFDNTIVLIPGWATDGEIFAPLDLPFNYLIPDKFLLPDFESTFLSVLEESGLDRVSILGWSMGAFIAGDIASKYPDKIDKIIFISARRKYDGDSIEKIKNYLKKNKTAYLYKFYKDFFSETEADALLWFKQNLLKNYMNEMPLDLLLEGLNYLSGAELKTEGLNSLNIKFIHGTEDRIAPIKEALALKKNLPTAKFISIENSGHVPFLNPDFTKIFHKVILYI